MRSPTPAAVAAVISVAFCSISFAQRDPPSTEGAIDWGEYVHDGMMHDVFAGEFQQYRKGSFPIRVLLQFYLDAFEAKCGKFLPPDAVVVVRKTIEVTRTSGGFEQRNVVDIRRMTMAPKFVDGYQNYPGGVGLYAISGGPTDRNLVKNVVTFLREWSDDVNRLFEVEACQGAAMMQFGENLARLTSGRQPIQAEPNAVQRLAAIPVRVSPQLEDADVRAKRARADAYWNAERATWGRPPEVQSIKSPARGNHLRISYAVVAPDFAIPIPAPEGDQSIDINVEKSYGRRIRGIKLVLGPVPYAIGDLSEPERPVMNKAARTLYEEGARVLSCTYDAVGGSRTFNYWYRESPKSVDLASLPIAWEKHPELVVRAPRTNCPVVMPK